MSCHRAGQPGNFATTVTEHLQNPVPLASMRREVGGDCSGYFVLQTQHEHLLFE